jgi:CRISPR-associated protein Csd1
MSWMSDLVATYDACADAAGVGEAEKMLIPIGFTTLDTHIEIIIDENGNFRNAERRNKCILSPVSEEAESRSSSKIAPYPLFEYVDYIAPDYNQKKFDRYVELLHNWGEGNQKLEALYNYVNARTIINDLLSKGIQIKIDSNDKYIDRVRFLVEIPGDITPQLWKDQNIFKKWSEYYIEMGDGELCYISGKRNSRRTKTHPKKIITKPSNAKLISSNENGKITWSGRFTKSSQALSVSYETSQKAHQALRWLIKNAAYERQSQKIIIWKVVTGDNNPSNTITPHFNYFSDSYETDIEELFESEALTDEEKISTAETNINLSYSRHIRKAIDGFVNVKKQHKSPIDVLAVDATTDSTGRLSVTFFEQLTEDKYLESVANWQDSCCWYIYHKRKNGTYTDRYVYSPSVVDIISACHGKEPKKSSESYAKIAKQERCILLHCVFRESPLPWYMVSLAVNNVSRPLSFKNSENGWDYKEWQKSLSVACAIVRRNIYDKNNKELFNLKLDETCTDRNYLFGRLLAVAERIEMVSRWKKGISKAEERPTNALNYMSAFQAHPFTTWNTIYKQIRPYRQHLNGAEWYQKQIDKIITMFEPGDYDMNNDKALNGNYLLGYSLQRMQYNNKNNKTEGNNNELTEQN